MWRTVEFGASHEGKPGVLLPDGSEPKPVLFDTGSGSHTHESSDWWIYDGTLRAPRATELRGSCSCGWRGEARYPLDWNEVDSNRPELFDTRGPEDDWEQHVKEVEGRTVPLPADLVALIDQVQARLDGLASDTPLAALRAVSLLEHATRHAGRTAAHYAHDDDPGGAAAGKALGITPQEARSRLPLRPPLTMAWYGAGPAGRRDPHHLTTASWSPPRPAVHARRSAERPAKRAESPNSSSIRISWLYFAVRSERESEPVLI